VAGISDYDPGVTRTPFRSSTGKKPRGTACSTVGNGWSPVTG
jgi:hypothetical protein